MPYKKLEVSGPINFHFLMDEAHNRVTFGVVIERVVPLVLETTFVERVVKLILPTKRKIVTYHSLQVQILNAHEIRREVEQKKSKKKSKFRLGKNKELSLFLTLMKSGPKYMTVTKRVLLKSICETLVLVSI